MQAIASAHYKHDSGKLHYHSILHASGIIQITLELHLSEMNEKKILFQNPAVYLELLFFQLNEKLHNTVISVPLDNEILLAKLILVATSCIVNKA